MAGPMWETLADRFPFSNPDDFFIPSPLFVDGVKGGPPRREFLEPGQVVEVTGPPGSGKTNFALRLALSLAKSKAVRVLIVDAESVVSRERLMCLCDNKEDPSLHQIHVVNCPSLSDFLSLLCADLNALVSATKDSPLRLLILDSLSFLLSLSEQDNSASNPVLNRPTLIANISQELQRIATDLNLLVICINQFTTSSSGTQIPALGLAWAHAPALRILLSPKTALVVAQNE